MIKIIKYYGILDSIGSGGAAVIGAGASLLGGVISAVSTGDANHQTEKFQNQMYDKQRADALADRDYANTYNSPAAVMARYKAGGLNPNLIYGNSGTPAAVVRSSSPGSFTAAPAGKELGNAVASAGNAPAAYINLAQTMANTNNLEAQQKVIQQELLNKQSQQKLTDVQTQQAGFDLFKSNSMFNYDLTHADLTNKKLAADTTYTLDQNDRQAALQANNLQQSVENILNSRIGRAQTQAQIDQIKQSIINAQSSNRLMLLDENLKKLGVQPGDPAYMRAAAQAIDAVSKSPVGKAIGNFYDKFSPSHALDAGKKLWEMYAP